jgi:hypothetical protein
MSDYLGSNILTLGSYHLFRTSSMLPSEEIPALWILSRNCSAASDKKVITHERSDFVNDHISSFFFDVQILKFLLEVKPPTVTAKA